MYENSLDGWLPVDKLGQILALIFVFGIVFCIIAGTVGCLKLFKRYLDDKVDLETTRWAHELEREKKEDENWRRLNPEYVRRIKELENTVKENQKVIGALKLDIWTKDEFLSKFKLKDLYTKNLFVKEGETYKQIWTERN